MTSYQIQRWDAITQDNVIIKPIIYIKPDVPFLEFVKVNNYAVICEISGTGTIYDGRKIAGIVDKSCFIPNCRPNFCEKTGLYIITLAADWYGYPDASTPGTVKIYGLVKPNDQAVKRAEIFRDIVQDKIPKETIANSMKNARKIQIALAAQNNKESRKTKIMIASIILAVIILALSMYLVSKHRN